MPNLHNCAKALGVDFEWLLVGDDAEAALKAQTPSEQEILRLVRPLLPEQQATVIAMLKGLAGTKPGG